MSTLPPRPISTFELETTYLPPLDPESTEFATDGFVTIRPVEHVETENVIPTGGSVERFSGIGV